jgi:hypothetical protein
MDFATTRESTTDNWTTNPAKLLPDYAYGPLESPTERPITPQSGVRFWLWRKIRDLFQTGGLVNKSIRLVTLHPGTDADAVSCSLSHLNLRDGSAYEALSYVWGDPKVTKDIVCNGRRLAVTTNLYTALQHLRHSNAPRVLWIDAICINQQDLDERAEQVQIMGQIFSSASQALVWLGEESENDSDAFNIIRKLSCPNLLFKILMRSDWAGYAVIDYFNKVVLQSGCLTQESIDQLANLFSREWFSRLWVVQEVGKSRSATVVCGKQALEWKYFQYVIFGLALNTTSLLALYQVKPESSTDGMVNALVMQTLHDGHKIPPNFDMLYLGLRFDCTDSRDRIFALLGVFKEDCSLVPDYNLDRREIYKRFTVAALREPRQPAISIVEFQHPCSVKATTRRTLAILGS